MNSTKISIEKNPEAEAFKNKGNKFFQSKNFSEAIIWYSEAIKVQERGSYYSNRAFCYMKLNQLTKGLNDALTAIKVEPSFFRGYSRAYQIYLMMGNLIEAEDILKKGIGQVEDGDKLRKELDNMKVISLHVKKMKSHIEKKNYKEAISSLEIVMEKCVEDDSLIVKKIELLCLANQVEEAKNFTEENQEKLKCMVPPQLTIQMVLVFKSMNMIVQAKNTIKNGLRNDPDNETLKIIFKNIKKLENGKNEGNDLFKNQNYAEAISKYDEVVLIDPLATRFNAVLLCNKATCLKKSGKKEGALKVLKEALLLNPKYGKGYLKKGDLEEEMGDHEFAKASYVKAKELDPSLNIDSHLQRVSNKVNTKVKTDYYELLGVDKTADEKTIKRAYKKLAMKWHPDRNNDSEEQKNKATKKFKEIVEANEVLSNPEKRKRYDMGGFDNVGTGSGHRSHSFNMGGSGGFPFGGDIFSMFMGGRGGSGGSGTSFRMNMGGTPNTGRRGTTGNRRRQFHTMNSGGFDEFFHGNKFN